MSGRVSGRVSEWMCEWVSKAHEAVRLPFRNRSEGGQTIFLYKKGERRRG